MSDKKKPQKKKHKLLRTVLVLLVIGIAAAAIYGYNYIKDLKDNPLEHFRTESQGTPSPIIYQETPSPNSTAKPKTLQYNDQVINVLLLGIDSNEEREAVAMGFRSDTMVVTAVDVVANKVSMLSIPRDTRIKVRNLADSGKVKEDALNKANAAFSFGGDTMEKRSLNSMFCISRFLSFEGLNIPMNYYVAVDMDGLGPIIDAVGGVEVVLDMDFPGYGKKGETIKLTSKNVMDFVRERKLDGIGDIGRTKHTQQVLLGIARAVKKKGAIQTVPALYEQLKKYVTTNLNTEQIAVFALALNNVDLNSIKFGTVEGQSKTISDLSYWIPDMAKLKQILLSTYYVEK